MKPGAMQCEIDALLAQLWTVATEDEKAQWAEESGAGADAGAVEATSTSVPASETVVDTAVAATTSRKGNAKRKATEKAKDLFLNSPPAVKRRSGRKQIAKKLVTILPPTATLLCSAPNVLMF